MDDAPLPAPVQGPLPALGERRLLGIERHRLLGYAFGVLTAACWATSPILIRKGLARLPSPLWGTTIGLSAASVVYVAWLLLAHRSEGPPLRRWREQGRPFRMSVGLMILAGLASALGSLGRTVAIDLTVVVVVVPLLQTTSLWTMVFAPPILGRHVERISASLLAGALLVVGGAALVIVGQNL